MARGRRQLAAIGAAICVSAIVVAAVAVKVSAGDADPPATPGALASASPFVRGALKTSGGTVDLDGLEHLGRAPTGEELFLAASADRRSTCFLVVDAPDATPLPGVSVSCGPPEAVASRGQDIWRDNPDGSVSLWLLGAEGSDGVRRARVRIGGREVASTPTGVISTEVPRGIRTITVTSAGRSETVTVPGR